MHRRPVAWTLATTAALFTSSCFALDEVVETEKAAIRAETFTDGLSHPWGLVFLPDGDALVAERGGTLWHVTAEGQLSEPIGGVPEVDAGGQGGLLDVALDPDFASNRMVYLSFAERGDEGTNSTAVARGRLADDLSALANVEIIFVQQPKAASNAHFGGRLVFDEAGYLFVTLGERSKRQFRVRAQDLTSHFGKVVRIRPDGTVPDDNPFTSEEGALPEIWSLGHRNIQAAAIHPETGALWEIEHGPQGGDEVNIVEPGKNYGWPEVSFGVNYNGTPVGTGLAEVPAFEPPIYQWTPVIAPSGMSFYGGSAFPEWSGDLFVGALKETALVRVELDGNNIVHEERILDDAGLRIRDVVEGPDGFVYLLTDEDNGEILRIRPAEPATTN